MANDLKEAVIMGNVKIVKLAPLPNSDRVDEYKIFCSGIYSKQEALLIAKKIKSVVYEAKEKSNGTEN